MDDFNVASLHESKNEWGSRLITILCPHIIDGFNAIFKESWKLCKENNEVEKYLMTFQNFITRIPKWNTSIIELERVRIVERSNCSYLEDLVTCVHIIQLKLLSAIRVGQKQKKIDISIPKLDDFIHKVYVNIARKVYKNVYLFEVNIEPLQVQKNNRELEQIVQECILNTVRESVPVEAILQAYMDETVEETITEEIKEEVVATPLSQGKSVVITEDNKVPAAVPPTAISFNNTDYASDENNIVTAVSASKDVATLEAISVKRNSERAAEASREDDDDNIKIKIFDHAPASNEYKFDIESIELPGLALNNDLLLHDIEELI